MEAGLRAKMTLGEFEEPGPASCDRCTSRYRAEDEAMGKKRIIHDATHGVRVNHRIKCRDKIRSPGARGKNSY